MRVGQCGRQRSQSPTRKSREGAGEVRTDSPQVLEPSEEAPEGYRGDLGGRDPARLPEGVDELADVRRPESRPPQWTFPDRRMQEVAGIPTPVHTGRVGQSGHVPQVGVVVRDRAFDRRRSRGRSRWNQSAFPQMAEQSVPGRAGVGRNRLPHPSPNERSHIGIGDIGQSPVPPPQPSTEQFRSAKVDLDCQAGVAAFIEGFEKRTKPVGIGTGAKPSGHARAEITVEHRRLSGSEMESGAVRIMRS